MVDPHPHSLKKNIQSESQPHCWYWQGYDQPKTQSLSSDKGDQHAGTSPKVMEKIKFKMNLNPTAGKGRGITKQKLTHL
jgi:hypothetical protein